MKWAIALVVVAACGDAGAPVDSQPAKRAGMPRLVVADGGNARQGEVLHARLGVAPEAIAQLQPSTRIGSLFVALRGRADQVGLSGATPIAFVFGPLPENWRRASTISFEMSSNWVHIYGEGFSGGDREAALVKLIDAVHAPEVMADISVWDTWMPMSEVADLLLLLARHGVTEVQLTAARDFAGDPEPRPGAVVPTTSVGQPTANGGLDKAIIRRYIKRNIQKIQYCYEKALLAKPSLQGTVTVQFTITPYGNVGQVTASGIAPEVSTCVAAVVKAIEFPKPKDGNAVPVSYPFTFRPAGG